jgi:hypothetical protein
MDRTKMTKINPNVERVEIEKQIKKGYSIQGTHCVLKPTQHETMTATYNQLLEQCLHAGFESKLTLDDHILITVNNVTGVTPKVKTFQIGASKTSNSTPEMIELLGKIDTLVLEYADCVINGKPMFMCTDNTAREFSATFTTRTPNGIDDRKQYLKDLAEQVKSATLEITK